MINECGPDNDRRILSLSLPKYHKIQPWNKNLGVLVSGGIDSALLYYLLLKQNQEQGNTHNIKAYTILRKEGSRQYALPVINYINSLFNLPEQELITSPIVVSTNPEGADPVMAVTNGNGGSIN
jgi:asparagine synthetase B (glutamine-hydrolysing)